MNPLSLAAYDYAYPDAQVAQQPLAARDASRLLHLPRTSGAPAHHAIAELPDLLRAGDLLLINTTKVLPARLHGVRTGGGAVELLLLREQSATPPRWTAIGFPMRKLTSGTELTFGAETADPLHAVIRDRIGDEVVVEFRCTGALTPYLERLGAPPLPPYITRTADDARTQDRERYQTVYAAQLGSAAAPTAGLHFSEALLAQCAARGIATAPVVLHVGLDTFQPLRTDDLRTHQMHGELFSVPDATWDTIRATKARGGRVIAIGTTSVRAIESSAALGRNDGITSLFITPGYQFQVIDGLLTNFHQPKSTLIVLVSALAGRERILNGYQTAIAAGYRLFSYGDAMLIL